MLNDFWVNLDGLCGDLVIGVGKLFRGTDVSKAILPTNHESGEF